MAKSCSANLNCLEKSSSMLSSSQLSSHTLISSGSSSSPVQSVKITQVLEWIVKFSFATLTSVLTYLKVNKCPQSMDYIILLQVKIYMSGINFDPCDKSLDHGQWSKGYNSTRDITLQSQHLYLYNLPICQNYVKKKKLYINYKCDLVSISCLLFMKMW